MNSICARVAVAVIFCQHALAAMNLEASAPSLSVDELYSLADSVKSDPDTDKLNFYGKPSS